MIGVAYHRLDGLSSRATLGLEPRPTPAIGRGEYYLSCTLRLSVADVSAVVKLRTIASAVSSSRVGSTRSTLGMLDFTAWRGRVRRTALPCVVSLNRQPREPKRVLVARTVSAVIPLKLVSMLFRPVRVVAMRYPFMLRLGYLPILVSR